MSGFPSEVDEPDGVDRGRPLQDVRSFGRLQAARAATRRGARTMGFDIGLLLSFAWPMGMSLAGAPFGVKKEP